LRIESAAIVTHRQAQSIRQELHLGFDAGCLGVAHSVEHGFPEDQVYLILDLGR
jgi:hypothetical protein